MGVYLRAKFDVSSMILTSFRQGGSFTPPPPPTSKGTPENPAQIRIKKESSFKKYRLAQKKKHRLLNIVY